MNIELNYVYSFKLNSGEEIISKVTAVNELKGYYVLDSPCSMAPTQQGIQLMPASFAADINPNGVNLYFHAISMEFLPREDMLDAYRQSTTGIKVPDKKIILG